MCEPANLEVIYSGSTGAATPFVGLSVTGFFVNLAVAAEARLWIGPEVVDLTTFPAKPRIVPLPAANYANFATTFAPRYSFGDPLTSTTTSAVTSTTVLSDYSDFAEFAYQLASKIKSGNTVKRFVAHGVWNRTTDIFTAASIDLVL